MEKIKTRNNATRSNARRSNARSNARSKTKKSINTISKFR